jgi:prephenate dehydrogenase
MKNILIIGCGLIGSSVLRSVIDKKIAKKIFIYEKSKINILKIKKLKLPCEIINNFENIVPNIDLIIFCTPLGEYEKIILKINKYLLPKTIITDVGSTKSIVMSEARLALKNKFSQFIGSHPIAGSEKHGALAAKKDLFYGKNIILTPNNKNSLEQIIKLTKFWESLGGLVSKMKADEHDQIFSTIRHLPHLLAFGLVNIINNKKNKDTLLNFAASGFRDFSRIAASSSEVWRDISIQNQESIIKDLQLFQKEITKLTNFLEKQDQKGLEEYLKLASSTRKNWTEKK